MNGALFVHIFLFRCPRCSGPIPAAVRAGERNMEQTDGTSFKTNCNCGWAGNHQGVEAKRHWVEAWE